MELDAGFQPGLQYGRGVSGRKVRDDRSGVVNPARRSGVSGSSSSTTTSNVRKRGRDAISQESTNTSTTTKTTGEDQNENDMTQGRSKNPRFADGEDEMYCVSLCNFILYRLLRFIFAKKIIVNNVKSNYGYNYYYGVTL